MTVDYKVVEYNIPGEWELDPDVGLSNIPNRRLWEAKQKVHTLNLLIVGPAGAGRSTLINTVCCKEVIPSHRPRRPDQRFDSNLIVYHTMLEEAGVQVDLSVTEVIGYEEAQGDKFKELLNDVRSQLQAPLLEQLEYEYAGLTPPYYPSDKFYHTVLFCMPPTSSPYLSTKDKEFLVGVKDLAYILPVICKADCFTEEELADRKRRVRRSLEAIGVQIFPGDRDDYYADVYDELNLKYPLTTIASTSITKNSSGSLIRSRTYPWGQIDVDDKTHNDLDLLQKILFRSLFMTLQNYANDKVYHLYRQSILPKLMQEHSPEQVLEAIEQGRRTRIPESKSSSSKIDMITQKAMERLRISSESINL